MRSTVPVMLAVLVLALPTRANGKFFWRETVPPGVPFQRALILHEDGIQTLVLQSQYQMPRGADAAPLGWVVPLPEEPELAAMDAGAAYSLFFGLSRDTAPNVVDIRIVLVNIGALGCLTAALALVGLSERSRLGQWPRWGKSRRVRALAGGSYDLAPAYSMAGRIRSAGHESSFYYASWSLHVPYVLVSSSGDRHLLAVHVSDALPGHAHDPSQFRGLRICLIDSRGRSRELRP